MKRIITSLMITKFEKYLRTEEKSENTIKKYMRDVKNFYQYANGKKIDKYVAIEFKTMLIEKYEITSANSIIAAVNAFLRFLGWGDCCIKQFKVQKSVFCNEEKTLSREEYIRLVNVAKQRGNDRLSLILQTICGTGIRVSELPFITIENVRRGEAVVSLKGKTRTIFIVRALQKKLLRYAADKKIAAGAIFITRNGNPMSRTNIWREMKNLCEHAGVKIGKVFPHNLRHLFARTFYGVEKDIAKLADILGHSSINTTRIYIITSRNEHRLQMENMRLII